ncbi:MAG: hypothetical protein ED559_07130 [Phycisphaera sp.]|nr:MAG: hypothetical protein ED559_07130 [Phycisphaera sp.]
MNLVFTVPLLLFAFPSHAEPGTVVLRNGRTIEAESVDVSEQSLRLIDDNRESVYGWHDISEVRGTAQGEAAEYMPIAETAWRGLSRLERGDRVAAEPALEVAFFEVGQGVGLTAAAVSKGLLECRVARGALALAVEPFLYVILNDTAGELPDGFDPKLRLCDSLPPIWGTQAGLSAMVTEISANEFSAWQSSERASQLAQLYATAAIHEISGRAPVPSFQPADEGVRLILEIVVSRVGSDSEREESRSQLAARLNLDIPDWQRAWIHASLGLSLLIEQDDRSSRLGVVQLLHVPSKYGDTQPYLAGVCLSRAALQLESMGRRDAALKLARTFQREFGRHDAGDMPGMEQLMQGEQGDSQNSRSDQEGV